MNLLSDVWLARLNRAVVSGRIIPYLALVMFIVMGIATLAVEILSPKSFDGLGDALWWSATTVTTIGYGDVVPATNGGRLIATFVMVASVATVSLTTAVITAAFVGYQQRQLGHDAERHQETLEKLAQLEAQIEALRAQR